MAAYWYFYAKLVVEWDIGLILTAAHLETFVTGSIAAFLGVGGIAGWNRDQPNIGQSAPVDLPVRVKPEPTATPQAPGHAVVFPPGYDYAPIIRSGSKALDLPLLRKELRRDEGVVHEIYLDSLDNKTAGIGRLITPDMAEYELPVGTAIDTVTVEQWFAEDIGTAVRDAHMVVKDFESHPQRVKHALVNLAFNLGLERLRGFKKTLAHIDAREYQAASIELLNSRYADQVKNRAKRVSSWIASGGSSNKQPDIELT